MEIYIIIYGLISFFVFLAIDTRHPWWKAVDQDFGEDGAMVTFSSLIVSIFWPVSLFGWWFYGGRQ